MIVYEKTWILVHMRRMEVNFMLAAVKGIIRGNTVVIEDDDIRAYDGSEVVVTLLEHHAKSQRQVSKKTALDWDSFVLPSTRGKNVDEYMKEMRDGDRI
ncbi:MAG: hypothetical protein LIO75_01110 [Lachnospiraceae bacterium]|nr:hypothetical protein [Lachnospiraceae bacterium]